MELYIYNRNLELQGVIDLYTSFRWVRRYSSPGEFELHCPLTSENLSLLPKDAIICKNDDDPEAAYVSYRGLSQDKEGKKVLVVKGKFLTGYLGRRIIWGTEIIKATTETAMRVLVSNNCITPQITARKIDSLILGDFGDYPETVDYQVSYKNLGDEVESLATAADLGYRVRFDRELKQLKFEVYKGLDRSVNQDTNPRAIFSQEYENVLEQEYIESIGDYRNFALIAGIGEGSARKTATIGTAAGLDRFEMFCDQNNLSNEIEAKTVDGKTTDVIASEESARVATALTPYQQKAAELEAAKSAYELNKINAALAQDEMVEFMSGVYGNFTPDELVEYQRIQAKQGLLYAEWIYLWSLIQGNRQRLYWPLEPALAADTRFDWSKIGWTGDSWVFYVGLQNEVAILKNEIENKKDYVKEDAVVAVTGKTIMSDSEYQALLITKGTENLANAKEIVTFNGTINTAPDSNLQYRVDYDLGDIVTQSNDEWGVELDARITEIEEVYEDVGMEINVTFGNDVPTLIDKIKQLGKG